MTGLRVAALLAGCASLALMESAGAGGFNRGSANLDGLYGDTKLGLYSGVTYVAPQRSYDKIDMMLPSGPESQIMVSQKNVRFANSYVVPYASVGGRIFGDVNCVGSYSQPFGADSEYSGAITFHTASQKLETNEFGLTCAYGFDMSRGRLSVIGGAFYETVDYGQSQNFTNFIPGVSGESTLDMTSNALGYRIGLGYEIPEYAFRAQLLYRSQTRHDATGDYHNTPFNALAQGAGMSSDLADYLYGDSMTARASGSATLPSSVDLTLQSGIAENWLAFGSIKWTDWSVLKEIAVMEGLGGLTLAPTEFYFEDGWTIGGGVGHRFSQQLAGSLSLTWDKGVSTGWDTLTDTWTLAGGVSYEVSENFQLRAGGAAIYLTEGTKSKASASRYYVASSPSEWGYALSISALGKF